MEIPTDIFNELTAGCSAAPDAPGSKLRAAPRVVAALPALVVRLNGDRSTKPMPATVRDLSTKGLGLECHEPLHAGSAFGVRIARRDGSALWLHCVSVRWSPLDGQTCSVGAKFTGMSVAKAA